jgi:hypothetical protein
VQIKQKTLKKWLVQTIVKKTVALRKSSKSSK